MSNLLAWKKVSDPNYVRAIISARQSQMSDTLYDCTKVFFETNVTFAALQLRESNIANGQAEIPLLARINFNARAVNEEVRDLFDVAHKDEGIHHNLLQTLMTVPLDDGRVLGDIAFAYDYYELGLTDVESARGDTRLAVPQTLFKEAGLDRL